MAKNIKNGKFSSYVKILNERFDIETRKAKMQSLVYPKKIKCTFSTHKIEVQP